MSALQHRAHLADRVQRLEAWAFRTGADVADIKAAVEELPAVIRQDVLAYTEPVFGEIMAGRATLATKEDLNDLERRLTELMEKRFGSVDTEFRSVNARFESVDAKLQSLDAKLDQVLAALGKTDG
jgi:chromosome segregation ATPase